MGDAGSPEALDYLAAAERAVSAVPGLDAAPLPTATVGVIGGGTMGAGIAASVLLSGRAVVMVERDDAALGRGLDTVRGHLGGALKRGKLDAAGHAAALARLAGATGYGALAGADLVIEAVFEDMEVKRAVFGELDRATQAGGDPRHQHLVSRRRT